MPVWEKGGAIRQLGGEVIFRVMQDRGPDDPTRGCNLKVSCTYAHRMQNTQDHIPFGEVLKIALTASPSNEFVSFRTSAAAIGMPPSSSAGYSSMSNLHPAYERSLSAPIQSLGGVQQVHPQHHAPQLDLHMHRAQTDVFIERSNAAVWRAPTDEESQDEVPEYSERIMSDSELETSMDGMLDSWGNQLHILRTRASENVTGSTSESIRAIRGRDSVRSSTGSAAASSIRAMRAVRVPRGPRMRMQSASAESLTCSRSRETIRSIGSGMDGIESVLEFGESISSPDLSLLAQLGKEATSSWRGRYATDSTSTLNLSVYYDAPEGVLEAVDAGEDTEEEEEGELGVTVDVVPVQSRPASRVTQSPEMQDQTFDSIQSEYSTASADRTEHLTSICSETSDGFEDDAEKLREILVMRASSSIRGRVFELDMYL
ncbi:hypothetical protein BT96DRAFT_359265 [Gymnopus androsaceus JB14]|uniref:Uncharacterized protein n=1 Tax=Gymnopus androsaceus JB14 TaxID=1447944 RepID=A0A6A4I3R3_9AGAR|nr:hypothetical protein BT96DRAFT_359265 [Gymnopus androsaceus JB14]